MRLSTERALIGAVLAISLVALGLQAFVLRPHLWPAGAGFALSGETVMGTLAAPRPVAVIRPPDLRDASGATITVLRVLARRRCGSRRGPPRRGDISSSRCRSIPRKCCASGARCNNGRRQPIR